MHDLLTVVNALHCVQTLFAIKVKKRKWFRYLAIREKSIYNRPFYVAGNNLETPFGESRLIQVASGACTETGP